MLGPTADCTFSPMSTFLEVVELLLTDDAAKSAYGQDPSGFLDQHGLSTFDSTDVADAMGQAAETLPIGVATQLDPEQGLDSAATMNLDDLGLSLEREPIVYDEVGSPPEELDPHDLDTASFGDDVDFDTPSDEPQAPSAERIVDELPPVEADTSTAADTSQTAALDALDGSVDESDGLETGDQLTDLPVDNLIDDGPLTNNLDLGLDDAADLEADLTEDVPDDFDLLD